MKKEAKDDEEPAGKNPQALQFFFSITGVGIRGPHIFAEAVLWSDSDGPFTDLYCAFMRGIGSPDVCTHSTSCDLNTHHACKAVMGLGAAWQAFYNLEPKRMDIAFSDGDYVVNSFPMGRRAPACWNLVSGLIRYSMGLTRTILVQAAVPCHLEPIWARCGAGLSGMRTSPPKAGSAAHLCGKKKVKIKKTV